jgi:hypothetical protein
MSLTTRFSHGVGHAARSRRPSRTAPRNTSQLRLEALETRTLLDVSLSVGNNVLVHPKSSNQSESSIAINPTNPLNLFAIANDASSSLLLANYSMNGGATWMASDVTGLPRACCDAQTAWDSFGNLFVTYISRGGEAIITIMSTDGGQTFTVINTTSGNIDQPAIAVGPSNFGDGTGSVWISYENFDANFGHGAICVKGAVVTGLGAVTSFIAAKRAPGSDEGLLQSGPGNFGDIAVGPNGQVLVAYELPTQSAGPAGLYVNLDPDGFSGEFGEQVFVTYTNVGGFAPITPQPNRSVDAEVNLAYDGSGGPHHGRVYMVYTDRASLAERNDTEIYERYSNNDGLTWSDGVLVNDDGPTGKAQFNPAIAVDQSIGTPSSGFLALTWYDGRASPLNNSAEVWGTISTDGGQTFLANVQISTGLINAHASDSGFEFGDFDTMDFNNGTFYRTWTDNTLPGHNGLDLATAPVTVIFVDSPSPQFTRPPGTISFGDLPQRSARGAPDPIWHGRLLTTATAQVSILLRSTASASQPIRLDLPAQTPATETPRLSPDIASVDRLFAMVSEEARGFSYPAKASPRDDSAGDWISFP